MNQCRLPCRNLESVGLVLIRICTRGVVIAESEVSNVCALKCHTFAKRQVQPP